MLQVRGKSGVMRCIRLAQLLMRSFDALPDRVLSWMNSAPRVAFIRARILHLFLISQYLICSEARYVL